MDTLRKFAKLLLWFWYFCIVAIGIAVCIVAFTHQPTGQAPTNGDPTGGAGFYAAIMALCVAVIALTHNATKIDNINLRDYAMNIAMGVGLSIGAYLWISSEVGTHPSDIFLLISVLSLFFVPIALGLTFALVFIPITVPLALRWFRAESAAKEEEEVATLSDENDQESTIKADLKNLEGRLTRKLYALGVGVAITLFGVVAIVLLTALRRCATIKGRP